MSGKDVTQTPASTRDLWLAAIISLIVSGTVSILTAWLMS